MDLVKVTWNDTEDFKGGAWASTEEVEAFSKQLCTIESVGWIVKRTKHYVTLSADFSPEPDTHGRVTKIAKRMIVKIEPLVVHRPSPTPVTQT